MSSTTAFGCAQPVSLRRNHVSLPLSHPLRTSPVRTKIPTAAPKRCFSTIRVTPSNVARAPTNQTDTLTDTDQLRIELVDKLIRKVQDTDRGSAVSSEERQSVNDIIDRLITMKREQMPPLNKNYTLDSRFFDKYKIAYSVGSSSQKSPPVGGFFRTFIGRLIFRTTGIFEHFIKPNVVIQMICFRFLGIINGTVALKGNINYCINKQNLNEMTFQFQRPRLSFGNVVFEYGPKPRLSTCIQYIDERIRIMQGRRGSKFIFIRNFNNDKKNEFQFADQWIRIYNSKPSPTILIPITLAAAFIVTLFAPLVVRLSVIPLVCILAFILRTAGVAEANTSGSNAPSSPSPST